MYDTINFRLDRYEVPTVSFIEETTNFFDVVSTGIRREQPYATGKLDNYSIVATDNKLIIKDGSFCKWFFGDNFQTLGRKETEQGIEKLSDLLHLPISKAKVTRLDIAENIILKHDVRLYLPYLGDLKRFTRLVQPESLYYQTDRKDLVFYDKIAEQKKKGCVIPEIYKERNVLRYELRHKKRLNELFKCNEVTADLLSNETLYIEVLNGWKEMYNSIDKYKDKTLNFKQMTGKKDLYNAGIIALVEREGGETKVLAKFEEMYKTGEISKKQAHDLKQAVKGACSYSFSQSDENELLDELNKKIKGAIRYYR